MKDKRSADIKLYKAQKEKFFFSVINLINIAQSQRRGCTWRTRKCFLEEGTSEIDLKSG